MCLREQIFRNCAPELTRFMALASSLIILSPSLFDILFTVHFSSDVRTFLFSFAISGLFNSIIVINKLDPNCKIGNLEYRNFKKNSEELPMVNCESTQ
jgi:hypothetical protein